MASLRSARPALRSLLAKNIVTLVPAKRVVPAFQSAPVLASRSFTSSVPRFGSGENDQALITALSQEQDFEKESVVEDGQTLAEQVGIGKMWEINDHPGGDVVNLTRKFGNESIKVTFRVSDWADITPEDEAGMAEEDAEGLSTVPITIVISKSSAPGAMYIEADAGRDGVTVSNMTILDKKVAVQEGAEGDHVRGNAYAGPHHHELDEELQAALVSFVEERGLNEALGNFVVSYAELKEQKDYVNWLDQVKGFVEA
ncbi:mitochondrial glyco protein [Kockovaella imperatae]|uniref:Mitochondrial glyco protein n=1 Tax=Kockovaella imperatae TaxID=4999 RepID=A0A1Y1UHT6_9TREE|nr:mitochondrial glyco protein [Kockovaella imperatae]ORX36645.1 mitochondrial glyco protein [Kockovaella imperatae]